MMNAVRQFRQMLFSRAPSPPRSVRTFGFLHLDSATKIEEERMPAYERNFYYPVRLGDVYHSRYQVLSKLGFGANSTVWFCRDLRDHRYVALKVYIYSSKSNREVEVLRHLSNINPESHPGRSVIRTMLDNFEINGS